MADIDTDRRDRNRNSNSYFDNSFISKSNNIIYCSKEKYK